MAKVIGALSQVRGQNFTRLTKQLGDFQNYDNSAEGIELQKFESGMGSVLRAGSSQSFLTSASPNFSFRNFVPSRCQRSKFAFMEPRKRVQSRDAFQLPLSFSTSRVGSSTSLAISIPDGVKISTCKLPPLPDKRVLAGVGTVTLDFLASVASFPEPDAKLRSLDSLAQGGGNVGNAMTAAARLGLTPRIFSKVANDAAGVGILTELESDGVDVSHIVVAEEGVSPFTYVIVDKETKTRTCIHTPGYPPLEPEELSAAAIGSFLDGADLVYLDGRIPDATILISEEATKRQLPIILDAERKREGLDKILSYADYLVTSAKFPQVWTECPSLAEAIITLALALPRLRFIIVTQGSAGCVMFERIASEATNVLDPKTALSSLQKKAEEYQSSEPVVLSSKVGVLGAPSGDNNSSASIVGRFLVGTATPIPSAEVIDTTGAGDAFIGAITYGILGRFTPEKMLPLAATVAAAKCRALGARTGLPLRSDERLLPLLV